MSDESKLLAVLECEAAERLRVICRHFPEDRFRALIFDVALVRLKYDMARGTLEFLRWKYDQDRPRFERWELERGPAAPAALAQISERLARLDIAFEVSRATGGKS